MARVEKKYKYITMSMNQPTPPPPWVDKKPPPMRPNYLILNNSTGIPLGHIDWYAPWRKWCFMPMAGGGLVFSADCLADIQDFIGGLANGK